MKSLVTLRGTVSIEIGSIVLFTILKNEYSFVLDKQRTYIAMPQCVLKSNR